jgi:UrcA family protein
MSRKFGRVAVAASLAVGLGLSSMTFAADTEVTVAGHGPNDVYQVVQYGDLDTTTHYGVLVLSQRIEKAAYGVCQIVAPETISGTSAIDNMKCRNVLVLDTVQKVNNPALSALYAGEVQDDDA